MADTVTKIRFWTIADFREEEAWLREMAREGLHLLPADGRALLLYL